MKKAFTIAVVAVVCTTPLAPVSPNGCEAFTEAEYYPTRIYATFLVDLPRCWDEGGSYVMRGKIRRVAGVSSTERQRETRCDVDKACRLQIWMNHPEVEVADYVVALRFRPAPDAPWVLEETTLHCIAAEVHWRCAE